MIYRSNPPIPSPVSAVSAGWVLVGLIIALLGSQRSLREASHAWSWRLALLLLAVFAPATLTEAALISSGRTFSVGLLDALALARELLPALVAIGIAFLASDARLALAATLYLAIDVVGRLQTLVAASGFVYFPRSSYLLETLMILLVGGGITTLGILRTRRPATG
jgi:hypothetical protein